MTEGADAAFLFLLRVVLDEDVISSIGNKDCAFIGRVEWNGQAIPDNVQATALFAVR